ncbi:MAG: hypothetical protein QOH93_1230 [Chloroflexia bacterium]|jgi:hypothetical protein|nr:hypothetical protein [Chloroflexia bacterium]
MNKTKKQLREEEQHEKSKQHYAALKAMQDALRARLFGWVREDIEGFRQTGGPTAYDLQMVCTYSTDLAYSEGGLVQERDEDLSVEDRERKAKIERKIARTVVVFSFLPGGYTFHGEHFDGWAATKQEVGIGQA